MDWLDLWQGFELDFLQVLDSKLDVLQQHDSEHSEFDSARDEESENCEYDLPLDLAIDEIAKKQK